jgi:hypothetical protein
VQSREHLFVEQAALKLLSCQAFRNRRLQRRRARVDSCCASTSRRPQAGRMPWQTLRMRLCQNCAHARAPLALWTVPLGTMAAPEAHSCALLYCYDLSATPRCCSCYEHICCSAAAMKTSHDSKRRIHHVMEVEGMVCLHVLRCAQWQGPRQQ